MVIAITDNTTDPLDGISEFQEWFNLVNEDDGWKIRQLSWPYWDQICEMQS